jgi:hypothetical protein
MGLIQLSETARLEHSYKFDSTLEITPGISFAKRGLRVVQEREKFDFLRYSIHGMYLTETQLKALNVTIQTNHPSFDTTTLNKFDIPQVERMKVTFSDKCEFKPLTFLGISSSADGANIELYSKEDIKAKPEL